ADGLPSRLGGIVDRLLARGGRDGGRSGPAGGPFGSVTALRRELDRALASAEDDAPAAADQRLPALDGEGRIQGRAKDLSRITAVLDAAASGDGALVIVRGAAGLGKTRLLRDATSDLRGRSGLVLRAKARETGISTPFGGVRDLLADLESSID